MASLSEFFSDPASAGTWTVDADQSTIAVRRPSRCGVCARQGPLHRVQRRRPDHRPANGIRPDRHQGRVAATPGSASATSTCAPADFFDVEKFPDISVVVTGGEAISGDTVELRARTDVKGTTKPVDAEDQGDGARRRRDAA